jgi:hypothetical protein
LKESEELVNKYLKDSPSGNGFLNLAYISNKLGNIYMNNKNP